MPSPETQEPSSRSPEGKTPLDAVIERLKDLRRRRDTVEYPDTRDSDLRLGEEEITGVIERIVREGALSPTEKEALVDELFDFCYDADPDEIPASRRLRKLRDELQASPRGG